MKSLLFALMAVLSALLGGCAAPAAPIERPKYVLSDFEPPNAPNPLEVSDPLSPTNRDLYRFNYDFDRYVFLPVVSGYEWVMPEYGQRRVSNFFDNLSEFGNFTNALFQLKIKSAGTTISRFAINTTVGIAGLWDPATEWKLQRQDEDFGQTLGHYGVGNGPYLVLPVLGPSNLRDTGGLGADAAIFYVVDPYNFDHNQDLVLPYYLGKAIDIRHRQSFRYYTSGSPFEYELVRLLYTEKRKLQIAR